MDYNDDEIGEGGEDADEEMVVIAFAYTVIEPLAMMVEIIDTTVTRTTMFA